MVPGELLMHYYMGQENLMRIAVNPIVIISSLFLLRHYLKLNNKFAEDYGVSILMMILINSEVDAGILLSPEVFSISPM